ncbi:hypothetical protein [Lysinibacillus fusiformis]|uniref:hypothetical protein n=1 Tax=Lysinibacillus fusiformis TaxID=28031 RepID=UPI003CF98B10
MIAEAVLASDNIREAYDIKQVDLLNTIKREGLAEPEMLDLFHTLRRKGNTATHEASYGTTKKRNN